jgi:hypothetical protein
MCYCFWTCFLCNHVHGNQRGCCCLCEAAVHALQLMRSGECKAPIRTSASLWPPMAPGLCTHMNSLFLASLMHHKCRHEPLVESSWALQAYTGSSLLGFPRAPTLDDLVAVRSIVSSDPRLPKDVRDPQPACIRLLDGPVTAALCLVSRRLPKHLAPEGPPRALASPQPWQLNV